MKKIDETVLREMRVLALWVLILSVVMQSVFLVVGYWNYTVLLGNLLIFAALTLNFLFMGMTVQSAVLKEEKEARQSMRASGMLRTFFMFVILAVGALVPIFNTWAVIIPVFFPRIIITVRAYKTRNEGAVSVQANGEEREETNYEE